MTTQLKAASRLATKVVASPDKPPTLQFAKACVNSFIAGDDQAKLLSTDSQGATFGAQKLVLDIEGVKYLAKTMSKLGENATIEITSEKGKLAVAFDGLGN